MPTKLILIRHGLTDWNKQKKYCGSFDLGLNEAGRRQVRRLRARLKNIPIHRIYASSKRRAIESARIIFKGREINLVPDLREMHFGIFEGLTYRQALRRHPLLYKKWLKDPSGVVIPEGEQVSAFGRRVIRAINRIVSTNKRKTVAVVCHGGSISAFINHISAGRDFWMRIPASASLSIVNCHNNRAKIELLNDVSHLKSLRWER